MHCSAVKFVSVPTVVARFQHPFITTDTKDIRYACTNVLTFTE